MPGEEKRRDEEVEEETDDEGMGELVAIHCVSLCSKSLNVHS
jgi:hypothetical protein